MKAMPNDEFAKSVLQIANKVNAPFEPHSYYNKEGDCIEFIVKPDDYYAKRIDDLLTVYYSRVDNQLAGSLIKGITRIYKEILRKYPGFAVEIHDRKVSLSHLFLASLWIREVSDDDQVLVNVYKELAEVAQQLKAETELVC